MSDAALLKVPTEPGVLSRTVTGRRVGYAVLLAVAMLVSQLVRTTDGVLALVWPAAAIGMLWLAGSAGRRGRWIDLGLLVAITALGRWAADGFLFAGLVLAAAGGVQAVVAVRLYRRLHPGELQLRTPADLSLLVLAGLVGALASAPLAGIGYLLNPTLDAPVALATWCLRTWVSTFVVGAILLRIGDERAGRDPAPRAPTVRSRAENALLAVLSAAAYTLAFGYVTATSLAYLVLPLAVWVALRGSTTRATVHVVLGSTAVIAFTVAGHGPWAGLPGPVQGLLVQSFSGVLALVALTLSLYRAERDTMAAGAEQARAATAEQVGLLNAVFASTSDAVSVFDRHGDALLRNPAAQELLGLGPEESEAEGYQQLRRSFSYSTPDGQPFPPADLPVPRALAGEEVHDLEFWMRTERDPLGRLLSVSARPLPGGDNWWSGGVVAAYRDVTQERANDLEITRARDELRGILDAATGHSIIALDTTGTITHVNVGAERMLGWRADELVGGPWSLVLDVEEITRLARRAGLDGPADFFAEVHPFSDPLETQVVYLHRDGRRIPVEINAHPMRDGDGLHLGWISFATDITARLAAESERRAGELLFRKAFDTAPMGMFMATLTAGAPGRITRVNRSLCRFLGRSEAELLAGDFADLVVPGRRAEVLAAVRAVEAGEEVRTDLTCLHADGSERRGDLSATAIVPGSGEPYLLGLVEDATARRAAEEELQHRALHDPLTGLPNRALFLDRLDLALAAALRTGAHVGLLYLDLDGFKAVNDTAGHEAGDRVLVQVTALLVASVRPGDTVARLGGDEFAIICPDTVSDTDLVAIGQRVVETLHRTVRVDGLDLRVGVSIGACRDDGRGDQHQLVRDADAAMFRAKRAGRNQVVLHGSHERTGVSR